METLDTAEVIGSALAGACERLYNDSTKMIEKREIIYNTLLKFCNDNNNCFLYDPSIVLQKDNLLFDNDNHFYANGYDASFKYLCDNFLFN